MKKVILGLSIGAAILLGCNSDSESSLFKEKNDRGRFNRNIKEIQTFLYQQKEEINEQTGEDKGTFGILDKEGNIIETGDIKAVDNPKIDSEGMIRLFQKNREGNYYYQFHKVSDKLEEIGERYKKVLGFSEGLAAVVKKEQPISFINKDGEEVFICDKKIKKASAFFGGYSIVMNTDGKYGYMNTEGEIVIPCKYDDADYFFDGLAKVVITKEKKSDRGYTSKTNEYSFIDNEGENMLDLGSNYDEVSNFSNGILSVKEKDGGYGYINIDGEELIKCDQDIKAATPFINGMAMIKKEGEYIVIDENNEVLVKADEDLNITFYLKTFAQKRLYYFNITDKEENRGTLEIKNFDGDLINKIDDVEDIFYHGPNQTIFVKVKTNWATYTIDGDRIDEDFEFEVFSKPDVALTYFPYNKAHAVKYIKSNYSHWRSRKLEYKGETGKFYDARDKAHLIEIIPQGQEGLEAIWQAQIDFESKTGKRDSSTTILEDFETVPKNHSSNSSGNIAKLYLATSLMKTGKFTEAEEYLEDFSPEGFLMPGLKLGLIGDCQSENDDYQSAVTNYSEAAELLNSKYGSVYFLKKAGILLEKNGKFSEAIEIYQTALDKYLKGTDITYKKQKNEMEKYLARAKRLQNKQITKKR